MPEITEETALGDALARRLSELRSRPVEVTALARLTGGASRETYAFSADGESLILRRDPAGDQRGDGMLREAAVIRAALTAGVPVARVVDAAGSGTGMGSAYLISELVPGETRPRRLLNDERFTAARARILHDVGSALARIHTIPVETLPLPPAGDPVAALRDWYDRLDEPLPVLEAAFRWLDGNRPEPVPDGVVHGDLRNGNLIVGEDGLAAILDWELVHRGDPREDLGWFTVPCWRFGAPGEAGGFGPLEDLIDGYASVAGWRPRVEDVRWWQVYGIARWAIGSREMAGWHLSGASPSIELAAVGRRVGEQEYDLLRALSVPEHPGTALADVPAGGLTGRPTAADLADAVRGFVRDEVGPVVTDRVSFLAKVAGNVLDCISREARWGAQMERAHQDRLYTVGVADQRALAEALREGSLSVDSPGVAAALWGATHDKLALWNPAYAAPTS